MKGSGVSEELQQNLHDIVMQRLFAAQSPKTKLPDVLLKMMANVEAQRIIAEKDGFLLAAERLGIDLTGKRIQAVASPQTPGTSWQPSGDEYDVDVINTEFALVLMGGKAVMIRQRPDAVLENRLQFILIDGFKQLYGNRFKTVRGRDGKEKDITWATAWLHDARRRQYDGIEFHPDPNNSGGTPGHINLWQGFAYQRSESGSYDIFRDHLLTNVCHCDASLCEWLFAWFADIFQRPRSKPGTSVVLRGGMGVGKSVVGVVFGELLGAHYFQIDDPRYLTGNFNSHMAACLLLQGEEAVWAGDKTAEGRLKGLITSEYQMIEAKGVDAVRMANYVRIIQTSNEDWVVPAGKDERRFAIFDVAPHCANNSEYFAEMYQQLNSGGYCRLLHDLLTFDLSSVNLRQIPKTSALLDQKLRSLGAIEAWFFDRLFVGAPTKRHRNWPEFVQCDAFRDDYIRASEEVGIRRKGHSIEFGMKLKALLPRIARVKRHVEEEETTTVFRKWVYLLPPLQECRDDFERALGQKFDWDDEDGPTAPTPGPEVL